MSLRPTLALCVLCAPLAGCTYFVRGGVTSAASTAGAGSLGGGVSGGVGLADDSGPLQGFHMVASLDHVGYDFVHDGVSVLGGGAIEYFYQSQDVPLGFHVGADGGAGVVSGSRGRDLTYGFSGVSLGGRLALDVSREFAFIELGGLLGAGYGLTNEAGYQSPTGFVGLVGITIGMMRVNSFDLSFR